MNAILLAAGLGTRLKPITNSIPKCLVKINNEHLLDIWINKLIKINVNKILINTHYLNNIVEEHIKQKNLFKEGKIILKYEKNILGTAGTLIKNIDFFENKDGLLIHADNFTTDNLKNFIKYDENIDWKIKMLCFKTNNPESCGIVKVNDKNIVTDFYEKQKEFKGNLANGAIYIIKKTILNDIKNIKNYDFAKEVIPRYLNKILVYETRNFFIDIGNINSLNEANNYVMKNNGK